MSFRREKYVPKGGPSGGDGGRGGSIYLLPDPSRHDLSFFRFHPLQRAGRGQHGQGSLKHGRDGNDVTLRVPPGTIAISGGEVLWDSTRDESPFCLVRGGRGGRGNAQFATSTRQAPRFAQKGESGEERQVTLQLRLIADCGLVGLPNAGKSTLLSVISSARPKIADYPFTTLEPNLGVVRVTEDRSYVVADIPGLISGAHRGSGLGNRFLKHIERTKILLYLVDASESSGRLPEEDYRTLREELGSFDPDLLERPAVVAASKADVLADPRRLGRLRREVRRDGHRLFVISAVTGHGVKPLLRAILHHMTQMEERMAVYA